ncbi:MAG: type IV secretion system protein VirB10 [Janthinobacterium lividum]
MSDSRNDPPENDIDRDGSVVSGPSRRQLTSLQKVGVAALLLVVFLSVIWIEQLAKPKPVLSKVKAPIPTASGTFRPAPALVVPVTPPPALPMPTTASLRSSGAANGRHEITPEESPIFAFSGGDQAAVPPAPALPPHPTAVAAAEPPANALSSRLQPTTLNGAKATLLPHPDMMMTEGTLISCTLQTAIDTQLAGYVKCVLPQDVRGTTGNVVLLDRGSTVVGEIQNGLTNGQSRVFVLWDRAETPDHAVITLSSPGTDELGRSGLSGKVNTHFWERFGGAIMLSVIQGGLQAGTALASNVGSGNGSTSTFFGGFQNNDQQVTNTALQATINIPPTLIKNQGDNISIFVARDLDFSDIYKLRVLQASNAQ